MVSRLIRFIPKCSWSALVCQNLTMVGRQCSAPDVGEASAATRWNFSKTPPVGTSPLFRFERQDFRAEQGIDPDRERAGSSALDVHRLRRRLECLYQRLPGRTKPGLLCIRARL
jgi:hypothetical protein